MAYRYILGMMLLVLTISTLFLTNTSFATESENLTDSTFQTGSTPQPRVTMEPFLQSDLRVISGNVQRPNGIFWFDNFLYTGCAGDFTLYRIDDTTGVTTTYIAGVQNTHTMYVEAGPVIWVADFQRNALVKVDTSHTPSLTNVTEGLASPWGLAPISDGSFLITQLRTDDLVNVTREGDIRVVASDFRNPTGIVVDEEWVYVGNNGSARRAVEWFEYDPSNTGTLDAEDMKPLVSGLQNTTNLVMGPDKLLYFAYSLGTRGIVGRVDPVKCREQEGCTNVDVEIVLWSELSAPLAGLSISDDMRLFVHTMFGAEIYWVQLPELTTP